MPAGITFGNQVQNEIDWWIFWGRVAGGLNRNQQADVFQRLSPLPAAPRQQEAAARESQSAARDVAHGLQPGTAAAANQDAAGRRAGREGEGRRFRETGLWCLSRIGARQLFYGPINQVLPPATATRWLEALLKVPNAGDTLVALARRVGDTSRDVSPATFEMVRRAIPEALIPALEGEEREDLGKVFGEELPSGLVTASDIVNEDRITAKLRRNAPLIGDDCAIVKAPAGRDLLFTTDFTIEGVHFTRDLPAEQVGHRALLRGLSDIAAMGGTSEVLSGLARGRSLGRRALD